MKPKHTCMKYVADIVIESFLSIKIKGMNVLHPILSPCAVTEYRLGN